MDSSEDRSNHQDGRCLDGRSNGPQDGSVASAGDANLPQKRVRLHRGNGEPHFVKTFGLGANMLATSPLVGRNANVLGYIIREMSYGSTCYTNPQTIAKQLDMDASSVRRSLRAWETEGVIRKIKTKCGGTAYIVNPYQFAAGDAESVETARMIWDRRDSAAEIETRQILDRIARQPRAD